MSVRRAASERETWRARREDVVLISALGGEGIDNLLDCVAGHLRKGAPVREVTLSASDGEAIAWLHANGEVLSQRQDGMETHFEVRLSDADWSRFQARRVAAR